MRWYTSDNHFGHTNIINLAGRPFYRVEEMNGVMVANWNALVRPDDTVYVLGDLLMGKIAETIEILPELNGVKHLVSGNHDPSWSFNRRNRAGLDSNGWASRFMEYGFASVQDSIEQLELLDGTVVRLCHFPYSGDSQENDRYALNRPPDDGKILFHGHTHSKRKATFSRHGTLQVHVGVDAWDFAPVSEIALLDVVHDTGKYTQE